MLENEYASLILFFFFRPTDKGLKKKDCQIVFSPSKYQTPLNDAIRLQFENHKYLYQNIRTNMSSIYNTTQLIEITPAQCGISDVDKILNC